MRTEAKRFLAQRVTVCWVCGLWACSDSASPPVAAPEPTAYALNVSAVNRQFETRDHFIAAVEMQLSGEPFAAAMGRDVSLYSRDYACQESVCSADAYPDDSVMTDAG